MTPEGQVREEIATRIYQRAEEIASRALRPLERPRPAWDEGLDALLTSRWLGFPVMFGLLGLVLWLTIVGANYPSELLATGLFWLEGKLSQLLLALGAPAWVHGLLVFGVYRAVAWVVAVMLPPMAIFFPLFSLLEDLGYLPRVAFNLDRLFKAAGAHGKQALTMCMGFGCNAAGVTSCRIIDSPRERLVAVLTNTFVPCNGRFPLLITLAILFMGRSSVMAAAVVAGTVLLGVAVSLTVSWALSRTLLRGTPGGFALELPPYRWPQVGRVLVRSFLDRTAFVLARAVTLAAPAGAIIWLLGNTSVQGASLLSHAAYLLDPLGRALGMDGFILLAFLLALPANELVIPIMLMGYLSAGTMVELNGLEALGTILTERGWSWLTALSVMLFSLLHYPCGTTLLTIYRETGRVGWALLGALIPLSVATLVCYGINALAHILS